MPEKKFETWKTKLLADKYLNGVRGAVPLAKEQFEVIQRLIRINNKPVESFIDLGSGDGILSSVLLSEYPEAKGVLVDISEYMLEAAKEKLAAYKDNLDFVVFDYSEKEWVQKVKSKAPFDVIVSGFSIHHQTDERKKEIYAEIYGLLGQGGMFINLEHVASPTKWVSSLFDDCFIDSLYELHKSKNSSITRQQVADELYNRPDKDANILAPVEEQVNWLRDVGFRDADCYFKIFELAVFGGRKL